MRKTTLAAMLLGAAALGAPFAPALAADQWRYAMSLIGAPQYSLDFKHFNWVNPDAPKGGSVTIGDIGGYDTLNPLPPGANVVTALGLIYDTLMASSLDEPATQYGLLAEAGSYPDDHSSVTYRLRQEAHFNDGTQVTPEDVIWSFQTLKDINPFYGEYYKNVEKAEQTGTRDVTFRFTVKGNRELPQIVGEMFVMPKHYWLGKDANGKPRNIAKSTLEPPVGSGPYRIKSVDAGHSIVYERVKDYWAKDLPVNAGMNNLDTIRYLTYGDPTVEFEAFKAGETEFRAENSSKRWAQEYTFKAITSGAAKKETYQLKVPAGMQGFAFNIRRAKFADPRVRQAFDLAFDFDWSNKNLFFNLYTRSTSYFTNSEYASTGLPTGRELELLNEVKDQVPPEVFSKDYRNPLNPDETALRANFHQAIDLLKQAGWIIRGGELVNEKTGETMKVEILLDDNALERVFNPYIQNLKRIGITANIRLADAAQYVERLKSFDYDMVVGVFGESESPGNEQREYWSSAAADIQGTRNVIGIKNPAVDKLVDHIILAKDHDELVAATRALDRVLLWNHYLVPNWYRPDAWLAYWDKFRHPEHGPTRSDGFPAVWWVDTAAAAKVDAAKGK